MNYYNVFGTLNTCFIFISLIGVYSQLNTLWKRKRHEQTKNRVSELLSLNQFSVSFLAYFSFFIYGFSIEPFNHYIVWPRLIASLLVASILFEIWIDRKSRSAFTCLSIALTCLVLGGLGLLYGSRYSDQSQLISRSLIIMVTLLIAQGYYHQIALIVRSGKTGAVDLRMSQFILMMDISTIAFAFSMGLRNGWPLLTLAIVSGITKLIIMYLFHWVRVSGTACQRRRDQATE